MAQAKVLLITKLFPPEIGGVPNYYYNLLQNCNVISCTVLTKKNIGVDYYDKELAKRGIKIIRINGFPKKYGININITWLLSVFRIVFYLTKESIRNKISVVIVGQSDFFLSLCCFLNKIITGKPYIIFLHGEEIPVGKFKSTNALKLFYSNAQNVFCNSEFTSHKFKHFLNIIKDPLIINPGVEERFLGVLESSRTQILQRKLKLFNKRIIYTIARLDERKGQDMVIKALSVIINQFPDLIYLIGGKGPRLAYLKELVESMHLTQHVIFLGLVPQDELVLYHQLGEIFIMPNRMLQGGDTEGFGISFLEANAVGNPVIGGKCGGSVNAIIDQVTGFLVDPENVEEIADKVILLLKDKALAKMMGKKGRLRVQNDFRWPMLSSQFEQLINKLYSSSC